MHRKACMGLLVVVLAGCATGAIRLPSVNMPSMVSVPRLPGTEQQSDEEQIAVILDDVQRGMESRRIYRIAAHLSRGYSDAEGRDYDAMTAHLNDLFERYRDIRIRRARPIVSVQGNQAQAVETFGTMADPVDATQDLNIRLQGQVTVYFEKIGDRWYIREWGRML